MSYAKQLRNELIESGKISVFETEVYSKLQEETVWNDFQVEVDLKTNELRAYHVPFTKREEDGNKIPFESVDIDDCFSLDEHLQELYSKCMEALNDSEFYSQI